MLSPVACDRIFPDQKNRPVCGVTPAGSKSAIAQNFNGD